MKNALPTHALQMRYHPKVGVKIPRYSCREVITQIANRNNGKKISCYMRDSAYRRRIVENAKIFWSCAKYFFNFSACKKLNGSPNDITEISASFLGLLKKQSTLRLPLFSIFFSRNVLEYWRNQSRKYFRDYRTYNTIQLFVAIKRKIFGLFFFCTCCRKDEFPKG